jgi:hypothetical protein
MKQRLSTSVLIALVLPLFASVAPTAFGIVTPPEPRVFASSSGRTGLKVLPKGNGAVGICFTLNEDGSERVLWRRDLVNVPGDVVVLDQAGDAHRVVVTLDTHGMLGGQHALVVYNAKGEPTLDASSQSFVPEHANPPAGSIRTSLGVPWRTPAWSVRQAPDAGERVDVHLGDGRVATVDLAAKRVTLSEPAPPKSPTTSKP